MRLQQRNAPEVKGRARKMRKELTEAEATMWSMLRRNQLDGLHFRREHEIRGFYVDFFCTELKLAIECDGESHFTDEGRAYDAARTAALEREGIAVLRFENREVVANPTHVLIAIRARIAALRG